MRNFFKKCTSPYCKGGQQRAKSTRRGARRVSKMWRKYRRRLRHHNTNLLRHEKYDFEPIGIPCTDGI